MTSFILAITLALQITSARAAVVPPTDVQAKVLPVLDLCRQAEASQGERQNAAFFQAAKLVGELFQTKTKSSDEALVVLMNFYIGEAPGEDLLHQVTVRGRRMLPLLVKYRDARVVFAKREFLPSILLSPDVKKENFDKAINSVKAGKTIGED
jgi:hypothetical protein